MRMARVVGEIAFPFNNNGGNSLSCTTVIAHIDISMDSRFEISHHKNKHQFSVFVRMYTWKGFSTLTRIYICMYNKYFDTLSAQYIIIPSICIISIYEPNQHAFALVRQSQLPIKPITITTTF